MPENTNKKPHTFDPTIQSENIAFKSDEMIECMRCGRSNPPNRSNCLYCADVLEGPADGAVAAKFTSRRLEPWERGFNVVMIGVRGADTQLGQAANVVGYDAASFAEILASKVPLPIARVESETEAGIIAEKLERSGVVCAIVSDDALRVDRSHVRLSGIEFDGQKITLVNFNTGERIDGGGLVLIVSGILTTGRVDSLEKKRRGGRTKLIDAVETSSDEPIVDLYTGDDAIGYRIQQSGFDYSCLGGKKTLLAGTNMLLLIEELKRRAVGARHIDSYIHVKNLIGDVWEIDSRKDFHGLQRSGFGKIEFGNVSSTSNLMQFNKFSRLQFHLR